MTNFTCRLLLPLTCAMAAMHAEGEHLEAADLEMLQQVAGPVDPERRRGRGLEPRGDLLGCLGSLAELRAAQRVELCAVALEHGLGLLFGNVEERLRALVLVLALAFALALTATATLARLLLCGVSVRSIGREE